MSERRKILILLILSIVCLSGCSTLNTVLGAGISGVGGIIGGTLKLVGKVIEFAGKLPMPPPGVF